MDEQSPANTAPATTAAENPTDLTGKLPVRWGRLVTFLIISTACLIADLASKSAIFSQLGPDGIGPESTFFGTAIRFRLRTVFNFGALWGMGQGRTWVFALLSAIAAVAILAWILNSCLRARAQGEWWLTVSLALVQAGTLGNLYDRLGLHGHQVNGEPIRAVRDFLYFRFFDVFDWAIFNVADISLVTGAIMLALQTLWMDQPAASTRASALKQPVSGSST